MLFVVREEKAIEIGRKRKREKGEREREGERCFERMDLATQNTRIGLDVAKSFLCIRFCKSL